MGTTVWILLLCAVPAVFSWRSTEDTKWTRTAKLNDSIKKLRMSTEACRQLSEAFGTLTKNLVTIPNSMFTDISPEITEEEMEEILKMVFGFDIVNDHQAREKYMCDITRSQTLSQLIQILEDKDVLYNVFRLMYDSTSMLMHTTKKRTSDTPLIAFIDAMESVGLMDLDRSRVEWLTHIGSFKSYWPIINHVPVPNVPGSLSMKCSHITSKFMALIRVKLYQPKYQMVIAKIHQITGLDVTDSNVMETFFCELIDGISNGVPGLYEVFQRRGVIWNVLKIVYPYIQTYEPVWREQLEIMLERNTIKPLPWNIFVFMYGQYLPRTYTVLSQDFDITDSAQIRHELKYDENLPRDPRPLMLTEVVQTVVDVLWKLEVSSLLRLPIDF